MKFEERTHRFWFVDLVDNGPIQSLHYFLEKKLSIKSYDPFDCHVICSYTAITSENLHTPWEEKEEKTAGEPSSNAIKFTPMSMYALFCLWNAILAGADFLVEARWQLQITWDN
ncbi:hypothetical protein NC651_026465 [Populus alba x Populus x berolinensis]|nr:hypothetical protein NC651_026465 [Populus alba x Populus x berolinensis]